MMNISLQEYVLEPKAPLVFRSGKPFEAGSRDGVHYPWPSSWAGLLRTRYLDDHGWDSALTDDQQAQLLSLPAHGAMLAKRSRDGLALHVTKPADALALVGQTEFTRLEPQKLPADVGSDLPAGLMPVGTSSGEKGKPVPTAAFWSLDDYIVWAGGARLSQGTRSGFPLEETRTHVAIDRNTLAADEGRLFRTDALDFGPQRYASDNDGGRTHFTEHDWVFVGKGPAGLSPGLVVFGGERRLSQLVPASSAPMAIPDALVQALGAAKGFALTLATPALFDHGWRPAWLDDALQGEVPGCPGLRVVLKSALVERWEAISGWDLKKRCPKATRRAVAAGATYWFEIVSGTLDPAALWLAPVSDLPQDRADGFGLALIRPWTPIS